MAAQQKSATINVYICLLFPADDASACLMRGED